MCPLGSVWIFHYPEIADIHFPAADWTGWGGFGNVLSHQRWGCGRRVAMMRVGCPSGTFMTSDVIAAALLEYALVLREADIAGRVDLPTISAGGEVVTVCVALLPGRCLVAVPEVSRHQEPSGEDAIRRMQSAISALRRCSRE